MLSIAQTIGHISYNGDSTFLFNQLYSGSIIGRMAERSKALVLGTSHFGGASSNLAPVNIMHRHCIVILSDTIRDFKTVSNLTLTERYN